ncbi:MAG: hypothetical protein M3N21_07925 [Actinomycetota bacterium]|nr:hypothetical protein [Actinomycetota bacterium]
MFLGPVRAWWHARLDRLAPSVTREGGRGVTTLTFAPIADEPGSEPALVGGVPRQRSAQASSPERQG